MRNGLTRIIFSLDGSTAELHEGARGGAAGTFAKTLRAIRIAEVVGLKIENMIGMLAAAAGWLAPVPGAIAQEVIDVLAVLNALRVAAARTELNDLNG